MSIETFCRELFQILILSRCPPSGFKGQNEKLYRMASPVSKLKKIYAQLKLRFKFILLINVKMPTLVGILTFIGRINTAFERFKVRRFF